MDADTLFWFYSTVAQVFGTLLALLGVFIVYRLQDQRAKIRDAYEDAKESLTRAVGGTEYVRSMQSNYIVKTELERLMKTIEDHNIVQELEHVQKLILRRDSGEQWIRDKIVIPIGFITLILITALIMLPLCQFVYAYSIHTYFFSGFVVIALVTVFIVVNFIKQMIRDEQPRA